MAKDRNTAQIVAHIAEADRDWLDREAARTGLNVSSLVRSSIRQQRLASEAEKPAGERVAVV